MISEDRLTQLVGWFESSEEATDSARASSERDRDYYDGKQLTDAEKTVLRQRKQPEVVINRIKRKVNFLTGFEKLQRTDPRAFPRTPIHDEDAEAATDAIRFVADVNEFEQTVSAVWENMLVEGYGGCEISISFPKQELMNGSALSQPNPKIVIEQWPWDRLGYDHHSVKADFSDARYVFGVIWMDWTQAKLKWRNAEDAISATIEATSLNDTYDDKPRANVWIDRNRKRVRVVQMYYREGRQWKWSLFTKGGEIKGGDVPYLDEEDESFNPMLLQSLYVDRDNNRYGEVRDMVHPQDEINKRRSKLLHALSQRLVIADTGAVENQRKAQQELAKADGFVEVNPSMRFEIERGTDRVEGQFALLKHATDEIDLMGPNASLQGKDQRSQSGRAIMAQQQGGSVEIATPMDRLKHFRLRVYRTVWNLVRQYWSAEQWIRVTDDENNVKFVGLNQPVTAGQLFLEQMQASGALPEQLAQEQQAIQFDPRASIQVGTRHNVAEMAVDIIVDEAPDTVTMQQEQFTELVTLAQAGVQFPPEVYIRASSLRSKQEILELLKGGGDDPEAAQLQNEAVQLQLADKTADVRKKNASASKDETQAMKNAVEAGRSRFEAVAAE